MKLIKRLMLCYLSGSLALGIYVILGSLYARTNPEYFMTIVTSPIQAAFVGYDVLVMGKIKLLDGFLVFVFGSSLLAIYFLYQTFRAATNQSEGSE